MMIPAAAQVERSIRERHDTDVPLINWWLFILLVNPVTLGIYGIVRFFKMTGRVDRFISRRRDYYAALMDFTEQYAKETGKYDPIHAGLGDLREEVRRDFQEKVKELRAGRTLLLMIVTLGIWSLVWLYRMNKVWYAIQRFEQSYYDRLSAIWSKIDLLRYPVQFSVHDSSRRSYGLYLLLSVVTLGIWGLVWDCKLHNEPVALYREFHGAEDAVLQVVRSAA